MSNTWAETCAPGHHYVAGAKLRPLTFGHAMLMERVGLYEILTPLEFHCFIGICSRNYDQGMNWLGWFLSPVGQWYYKRKPMPKNKNEALAQAMEYLIQAQQIPELIGNDDNVACGARFGAPLLQTIRSTALEFLNYQPETINDAPFGQLVWDILARNEMRGGAKIIHGEFAEGLEALKQLQNNKKEPVNGIA
jgi:hypothetical protein